MNKTNTSSANTIPEAGLRRYAMLGIGTAVLAGTVTTTDASVVYTNYNNLLLNDTVTTDTADTLYKFDVNGDGVNDITFAVRNEGSSSSSNFALVLPGLSADNTTFSPLNIVGTTVAGANQSYNYPSRITTGTISSARNFVTLALTANSQYLAQGTFAFGAGFTGSKWKTNATRAGYLGFSFTLADGLHYGFVGMTVVPQGNGVNSRAISIGGIGYQTTPGAAITVSGGTGALPGAVPEPSSIAMLALGAGGLAAYRQRRKKAAAKPEVAA